MAMSKSVSVGSIVTGCLLLVLTLISVIFGCVVLSKEPTNATLGSLGLWALYVSKNKVPWQKKTMLRFPIVSR